MASPLEASLRAGALPAAARAAAVRHMAAPGAQKCAPRRGGAADELPRLLTKPPFGPHRGGPGVRRPSSV
jgi:hypothetical protein